MEQLMEPQQYEPEKDNLTDHQLETIRTLIDRVVGQEEIEDVKTRIERTNTLKQIYIRVVNNGSHCVSFRESDSKIKWVQSTHTGDMIIDIKRQGVLYSFTFTEESE